MLVDGKITFFFFLPLSNSCFKRMSHPEQNKLFAKMSRFRFFFLFQFAHVPERFHFYAGRKKSLREKKEGIHVMEERMSLQLTSPPPLPEKKKHFWVWGGEGYFELRSCFTRYFSLLQLSKDLSHTNTPSPLFHMHPPPQKKKKKPTPNFVHTKALFHPSQTPKITDALLVQTKELVAGI